MFSLKNLIFQVLVLAIIAALANCSPSNRLSGGVSRRSESATDNTATTAPGSGNVNILDQAQFEASGLALITLDPSADDGPEAFIACETTNASPWIWNSHKVADFFSNFNGWYCCNWNVSGGGCSHMMTIEDASVAFCGNEGCIKCEDMRSNVYKIVDFCKRDNKAGGVSFFVHQGNHVVLY